MKWDEVLSEVAKDGDPQFMKKLLTGMEGSAITFSENQFRHLFDACYIAKDSHFAFQELEKLHRTNRKLFDSFHERTIEICGRAGDTRTAKKILKLVRRNNDSFTLTEFEKWMMCYAIQGDYDSAQEIFDYMIQEKIPTIHTYNILLIACANSKNIQQAESIFKVIHSIDLLPDEKTWNLMIETSAKAGDLDKALSLLKQLITVHSSGEISLQPNPFNYLMSEYLTSSNREGLVYIYSMMRRFRVSPNHTTYCILLKAATQGINVMSDPLPSPPSTTGIPTFLSILTIRSEPETHSPSQIQEQLLRKIFHDRLFPNKMIWDTLRKIHVASNDYQGLKYLAHVITLFDPLAPPIKAPHQSAIQPTQRKNILSDDSLAQWKELRGLIWKDLITLAGIMKLPHECRSLIQDMETIWGNELIMTRRKQRSCCLSAIRGVISEPSQWKSGLALLEDLTSRHPTMAIDFAMCHELYLTCCQSEPMDGISQLLAHLYLKYHIFPNSRIWSEMLEIIVSKRLLTGTDSNLFDEVEVKSLIQRELLHTVFRSFPIEVRTLIPTYFGITSEFFPADSETLQDFISWLRRTAVQYEAENDDLDDDEKDTIQLGYSANQLNGTGSRMGGVSGLTGPSGGGSSKGDESDDDILDTLRSYDELMSSYSSEGNLKSYLKCGEKMIHSVRYQNMKYKYSKTLTPELFSDLMKASIALGKIPKIEFFYEQMEALKILPNKEIYYLYLQSLVYQEKYQLAQQLFFQNFHRNASNYPKSSQEINLLLLPLLNGMMKHNDITSALSLLLSLSQSSQSTERSQKRDVRKNNPISVLTSMLFGSRNQNEQEILDEVNEIREESPFWVTDEMFCAVLDEICRVNYPISENNLNNLLTQWVDHSSLTTNLSPSLSPASPSDSVSPFNYFSSTKCSTSLCSTLETYVLSNKRYSLYEKYTNGMTFCSNLLQREGPLHSTLIAPIGDYYQFIMNDFPSKMQPFLNFMLRYDTPISLWEDILLRTAKKGLDEDVAWIIQLMETSNKVPHVSLACWLTYINVLCANKKMVEVWDLVEQLIERSFMREDGFQNNELIQCWYPIFNHYGKNGDVTLAKVALDKIRYFTLTPDAICWQQVIMASIKRNKVQEVLQHINEMKTIDHVQPNQETYSLVLDYLANQDLPHQIVDIIREMEKDKISMNQTTWERLKQMKRYDLILASLENFKQNISID